MGFQSKIRQKSLENANIDFSVNLSYLETPRLFKTKTFSVQKSVTKEQKQKRLKKPRFYNCERFPISIGLKLTFWWFYQELFGHTFIKEKSACFQEASVRIWRNDSLIHHQTQRRPRLEEACREQIE